MAAAEILAILLAVSLGFNAAVLIAIGLYVIAPATFANLHLRS